MESKLSDRDLEVLLDIYSKHETLEEKLIYDMAIELKTYRDLEKHGVLVRVEWAKSKEESD